MRRYSILLIATLMGFILCACNVKKDEISLKNEEEVAIDLQKNFDYPEKPLKYKHIRRISD